MEVYHAENSAENSDCRQHVDKSEMVRFELCAEIKSDPLTGQIPLIFITAISDAADEAKWMEYGAIDYITKPIFPPIAKARIKNHLELKRNRDALEKLTLYLSIKNRLCIR